MYKKTHKMALASAFLAGLSFVPTYADEPAVQLRSTPFPLSQVRLLDGPFKEKQDLNARYLLDIVGVDRLLSGFRAQAGLPEKAKRYGGWETRGINGHSLGHYLSAVSALYASTGDSRALERVNYIVAELAACQKANGDGYVLPVSKRIYDDLRAGRIKATGFNLNGEWVPNYTLHKVFAGLRDAYRFAGSTEALQVERALADFIAGIYVNLTPAQAQEILSAEFGGLNEVFADLTVDTGDPRYLQLARTVFTHEAILAPLKSGRDELTGKHGNTQVPKLVGLAREYQLTGDAGDLTGVNTFWDSVVERRSYVMGGHGDDEHFFPPEQFPKRLRTHTAETCNTYNMIKLTGLMFEWEPNARLMDFVERSLVNHLLANIGQNPGEFGYFLSLESVATKVFSTPHDSWWCCVGTGMENPARYGEQVYSHHGDALWVNLYMASELVWRDRGVTLRQETRFPDADTARFTLTLTKPTHFNLKLRHPAWCAQPEITINGQPIAITSTPSSYLGIERLWQTGDQIDVRLPMTLRAEPLPHSNEKIVALMYGPLVLAGVVPPEVGKPDPAKDRFGCHLRSRGKTDQTPPVFVVTPPASWLSHIRPDGGAFASFRSDGIVKPADLAFIPLHRVYEEHYAVYFPLFTPADWITREGELRADRERQVALEAATLDTVLPGFQQSEVEHRFASLRSATGDHRNRKWRDAFPGGWFSYEMAVDPEQPVALVATYYSDNPGREFELQVDGRTFAIAKPALAKRGVFFEAAYAIPTEFTRGKKTVTVRLVATRDRAGTFGFRTLLAHAVSPEQWAAGQRAATEAIPAMPNVVVMIADDLGYADVSCLGNGAVKTPNIDRLAQSGVKFTSGYVPVPLCGPSRAGFFTGRYPQRFGFVNNGGGIPTDLPLLPGILRDAGYYTGLIGKWHSAGPMPHERGCFDETLCSPKSSPYINYYHPKLARNGKVEESNKYSTDLFADEAVKFIERNQTKPFSLNVTFNAPHILEIVEHAGSIGKEYDKALAADKTMDVPKAPMARPADAVKYAKQFPGDSARADTVATIVALDEAVGRILDKLKQTGLDNNTIVFFFADNGGHPENRSENLPLRDYKWSIYEGGIRVPFLAAYPGVFPAGMTFDHPVSSLDILPTVCALAGAHPPAGLDGVNLTPFLKGDKTTAPHEELFFSFGKGAVRQKEWKLVLESNGTPHLFDLVKDVEEKNDLALTQPERVKELTAKWQAWNAQMPDVKKIGASANKLSGLKTRKAAEATSNETGEFLSVKPAFWLQP